jgi:hypothetical protein
LKVNVLITLLVYNKAICTTAQLAQLQSLVIICAVTAVALLGLHGGCNFATAISSRLSKAKAGSRYYRSFTAGSHALRLTKPAASSRPHPLLSPGWNRLALASYTLSLLGYAS